MSNKKTPYSLLWIVPLFGIIAIVFFALNEGSFTKDSISKASQAEFSGNSSKSTLAINPIHILSGGVSIVPIFHQPILDWGTRTFSGLTYIFAEGDPKEVALRREDFASDLDLMYQEVVSKRFESNLRRFLENPSLGNIINKCGHLLKPQDGYDTPIIRNFPDSIFTTTFNLEDIIVIDAKTGRKAVNHDRYDALSVALAEIYDALKTESFAIRTGSPDYSPQSSICLTSLEVSDLKELRQELVVLDVNLQNNPESFYDNPLNLPNLEE